MREKDSAATNLKFTPRPLQKKHLCAAMCWGIAPQCAADEVKKNAPCCTAEIILPREKSSLRRTNLRDRKGIEKEREIYIYREKERGRVRDREKREKREGKRESGGAFLQRCSEAVRVLLAAGQPRAEAVGWPHRPDL